MATIDDGGPAFPRNDVSHRPVEEGMSLRDWFAGQALAGLAANPNESPDANTDASANDFVQISRVAYEMADAMLTARKLQP